MGKGSFQVDYYSQDFWVEPEGINGQGDSISPFLCVPVHLELRPPHDKTSFILFTIEAELWYLGFKNPISEVTCISNKSIPIRTEGDKHTHIVESLKFPMNQEKLTMIEQHRTGDAYLGINLKFHYGIYSKLPNEYAVTKPQKFVEYYETAFTNSYSIVINKAKWIERILPALGYKAFRLIEIPVESDMLPKQYKESIAELDEAKKYYLNNDYDKVVAHCRSALEPFKDKIKQLKVALNEEKANYLEKITVSTNVWLNDITRATKALSSTTTHHAPSFGHFSKGEAEVIYTITVAIIGYIGRIPT